MNQRRRSPLLIRSARLTTGILVAAGCVLGIAVGVTAPWPRVQSSPAMTEVTPRPGATVLACVGPFRALGRDAQNAMQMSVAATPTLTWGTTSANPQDSEMVAVGLEEDAGVPLFTVQPEGDDIVLVAAAESIELRDADLAGFAAAPCRPAAIESWLVGGVTATGASDILLLANPAEVPSSVTLTVWGTQPVSSTAVVPARTQIAIPLAANAAGQPTPVVQISASGAPVRAALQSSLIRTLDPGGIDIQDSAGEPRPDLVLAGIQVRGLGADIAATVLRVMATEAAGIVRIDVLSADGRPVRTESVPLEQGVPAEISLAGLDAGVYSIRLTAEAPLVAGAWQTNGFGAGSDFAWMTPAPALQRSVLVAVPEGPDPQIHLVSGSGSDAQVRLIPRGSAAAEVIEATVPAGSGTVLSLHSGRVYELSSTAPVHAALLFSGPVDGGEGLAGWPVWDAAGAADPVIVFP